MIFLDLKILDFIEELAEKYSLDKELEADPLIKENLSEAESFGEKQFIKILYSTKRTFPSMILKDIIKDYIDKKISSSLIKEELKEKLSIKEDVATQIFQNIMDNTLINETLESFSEDPSDSKKINKDGLSQELK